MARYTRSRTNENKKRKVSDDRIRDLQAIFNHDNNTNDKYSQQNLQLAKENSILKLKINELETNLNQLVSENLSLRRDNVLGQVEGKQRLEDQIHMIENGIIQRFDEIVLMFDNVRKREGLPSNQDPNWSRYRHVSKLKNQRDNNKRDRRKSMFIERNDLTFNDMGRGDDVSMDHSLIPILNHPDNVESHHLDNVESPHLDNVESPHLDNVESPHLDNVESPHLDNDYSIPEEDFVPQSTNLISSDSSNTPIVPPNPISKRKKRSLKVPPKIQKSKKSSIIKDDIMPRATTPTLELPMTDPREIPTDSPQERPNRRSTRGKIVNYKLPSLRAKMRRPQEQLVDATTVNDIHDYEVNIIKEINDKNKIDNIIPIKLEDNEDNIDLNIINKQKKIEEPINNKEILQICGKKNDIDPLVNNIIKKPPVKVKTIQGKKKSLKKNINKSKIVQESSLPIEETKKKDKLPQIKKTTIYNDDDDDDDVNEFDFESDNYENIQTENINDKKRKFQDILTFDDNKENDSISKGNIFIKNKLSPSNSSNINKSNKNIQFNIESSSPSSSSKIIHTSRKSSSSVLSDITNKSTQKKDINSKSKKKLLRTAIINDLYNDAEDLDTYDSLNKRTSSPLSSASSSASFRSLSSSFNYNDNTINKTENKTVSFRFNDDDLSVFDLLDKNTNRKKSKSKDIINK